MKRLLVLPVLALALAACKDTPIPSEPSPADAVPGDVILPVAFSIQDGANGGNEHFYFLPPIAPDPTPTGGTFDPSYLSAVRVEVCELTGSSCAGAPVAVFTGDGSLPDDRSVQLNARKNKENYLAEWKADAGDGSYRIAVLVGGLELGYADIQVVESAKGGKGKGSGIPTFKVGEMVPIKFRIEEGAVLTGLVVRQSPGVQGGPSEGEHIHEFGSTTEYAFEAASDHSQIEVVLDGEPVAPSGSILMDRNHTLTAVALPHHELPGGTAALAEELRAVLTSGDPVAAYQALLNSVAALYAAEGAQQARQLLAIVAALSIDPVADADLLRELGPRLGGHVFEVPSVLPSLSFQGPQSAAGEASALETTALYVNGIMTSQGVAALTQLELDRLVRAAGLDFPRVRVKHYWNPSGIPDPSEGITCPLRLLELFNIPGLLDWAGLVDVFCGSGQTAGAFIADLEEAINQVLALRIVPFVTTPPPVDDLLGKVNSELEAGRAVILVAHSQGNLFTQQALRSLSEEAKECVEVVSLASPMSADWDIDPTRLAAFMHGGAKAEDMLLMLPVLFPGVIPSNLFPRITSAATTAIDAEIAVIEARILELAEDRLHTPSPGAEGIDLVQTLIAEKDATVLFWALQLHLLEFGSPDGSHAGYLGPAGTRTLVQDLLVDAVERLEGRCQVSSVARVEVSPASATIQPGGSVTLTAKAFDADGNEVPASTIQWYSLADWVELDPSYPDQGPSTVATASPTATSGSWTQIWLLVDGALLTRDATSITIGSPLQLLPWDLSFQPWKMNNVGHIVGTHISEFALPFIWDGVLSYLPVPEGPLSRGGKAGYALGVNDAGDVVGKAAIWFEREDTGYLDAKACAVLWRNRQLEILDPKCTQWGPTQYGTVPGELIEAYSINNSGQILGLEFIDNTTQRYVLISGSSREEVAGLDGVRFLDDAGRVFGYRTVWQNGNVIDFSSIPGDFCNVSDSGLLLMRNSGHYAWYSTSGSKVADFGAGGANLGGPHQRVQYPPHQMVLVDAQNELTGTVEIPLVDGNLISINGCGNLSGKTAVAGWVHPGTPDPTGFAVFYFR